MPEPKISKRSRFAYGAVTLGIVLLGIASRKFPGLFPVLLGKYPGDALWTLMVFFGLGIVLPRWSPVKRGVYALMISFLVEIGQLYQEPWISAIRGTTLGHMVLGSTFSAGDLVAYTAGVVIGVGAEILVCRFRAYRERRQDDIAE
ncbi:MAG: DUF2809 domain-containing protein [Armatimonadota bacterium]